MTQDPRNEAYENVMKVLKPALERVVSDPAFRNRLELQPLEALAEMNVELDAETKSQLEGKRFSEFWALRRKLNESSVGVRDLPPADGALDEKSLDQVSGGLDRLSTTLSPTRTTLNLTSGDLRLLEGFAPPYVPV